MITRLLLWTTAVYGFMTLAFVVVSLSDILTGRNLADWMLPELGQHPVRVAFVWTSTAAISLVLCAWIVTDANGDLRELRREGRTGGINLTARINIVVAALLASVHFAFGVIGFYSLTHLRVVQQPATNVEFLLGMFFILAALDLGAVSWLMIWLRQRLRSEP